jgi:hypothetical protein
VAVPTPAARPWRRSASSRESEGEKGRRVGVSQRRTARGRGRSLSPPLANSVAVSNGDRRRTRRVRRRRQRDGEKVSWAGNSCGPEAR